MNPEGLRSAVSRAYYAAFNVTAEFLSAIGDDVPRDTGSVRRWVEIADAIIKTLDEYKDGPAQRRNHIAKAVTAYRKTIGS